MTLLAAVPTLLIGGVEALGRMAAGAGLGLGAVLGGYAGVRLALRRPDPYAVRLVVGGFVIRLVLLVGALAALVAATGLDPAGVVPWLAAFYFVLVLAEAWVLARAQTGEGVSR